MQWEYTIVSGRIMAPENSRDFRGQGMDVLWKAKSEAPSTWQFVQEAGREGWEMVNAFPIAEYTEDDNAGYTSIVAFVFKRPLKARQYAATPNDGSNQRISED